MIPVELQRLLHERVKNLFSDHLFKNSKNEDVHINIFKQHLPPKKTKDDEPYPYIIIKLIEGEQLEEENPFQSQIMFVIGLYAEEDPYQGYLDVTMIIQKIFNDLKTNPVVGSNFELQYPVKWALHDEDVYPYYFGGIETTWSTPSIIRRDVEAMI
ncbi:hypothetical protein [Mesobacillus thioparans]|uniref:hypothetical protein n=1 Tax=Mesobacillus thioparans TaxID=370439 RepID=UPI0039F02283